MGMIASSVAPDWDGLLGVDIDDTLPDLTLSDEPALIELSNRVRRNNVGRSRSGLPSKRDTRPVR